jgi:broad specificity phosphatase PhoE
MDLLSSLSWGKPVIKLLSYANELENNCKMSIFLRHSAREEPKEIEKVFEAPLTQTGRDAAFEFGFSLPNDRTYRLFHSLIDRCRETAEFINKGIINKKGTSIFRGEMETLTTIKCSREKFIEYVSRDSYHFVDNWLAGHYPEMEIEPSIDLAKRTAQEITQISHSKDSKTVDIYVTHDFHILVYLFHWAGVLSTKQWIQYLDGFILQFKKNKIFCYYHEGKKEIEYPAWWEEIPFTEC